MWGGGRKDDITVIVAKVIDSKDASGYGTDTQMVQISEPVKPKA